MSEQFPPQGPQGPGAMPPGQPQGHGAGEPEYLSSGAGDPVGPAPVAGPGGGRRKAIIGGAVLGGLAIAGGAAYGITSFMSSGAQAAEALPAGTVGYVSVNLDPGGAQKIEAIKTLRTFPAFRDEVDLQTDDDLRKRLFEELQKSGACESVDYDEDVEPWLGDRMAVAAVDTGAEQPSGVVVVEVTDGSKAEGGLAKLQACAGEAASGEGESLGGFVVSGDWVVIAETEEIAQQVTDAAAEKPLSDDATFNDWVDEAGDEGVVTMYAAPAAGEYLAGQLGMFDDQLTPPLGDGLEPSATPAVPPEVTEALEDFEGAAATIRFDDGGLEVEVAADAGAQSDTLSGSDRGGDVVETLPEDTLLAFGVGFADDWFGTLVDQLSATAGGSTDVEAMIAEVEQQTGLSLPEDAETLVGKSMAIAVGGDIDPEAIFNGGGPADVPVGVKVQGDPEAIAEVLATISPQLGEQASLLESEADGDHIAIGPNADYRSLLVQDGGLGDTDAYQEVIEESDRAGAVLFLNFDANGDWLSSLSADDPSVAENVEPLSAFGISGWVEDGVSHGLLKLTTD